MKVLNSSQTSKSVRLGARSIAIPPGVTKQPDNEDLASYVKRHPDLSVYIDPPVKDTRYNLKSEPTKVEEEIKPVAKVTAEESPSLFENEDGKVTGSGSISESGQQNLGSGKSKKKKGKNK